MASGYIKTHSIQSKPKNKKTQIMKCVSENDKQFSPNFGSLIASLELMISSMLRVYRRSKKSNWRSYAVVVAETNR